MEPLDGIEARVLGCLIEKELATPDYYPMTLNSLTAACNQKSNRDPVMQLEDGVVIRALDGLRAAQLAWEVSIAGTRVPKYKHRAAERFGFSPRQVAVLCELLVRGPQTVGELRTRASRLVPLESVDEAAEVLNELLASAEGPFVVLLPRESGRREPRYAHLLCGPVEVSDVAVASSDGTGSPQAASPGRDRIAALESAVSELRETVRALQEKVDALRLRSESPGA